MTKVSTITCTGSLCRNLKYAIYCNDPTYSDRNSCKHRVDARQASQTSASAQESIKFNTQLRSFFTGPRRLICCISLFLRQWIHICSSFCHSYLSILPSFGVSGGLCFVVVAVSGYLSLYFR